METVRLASRHVLARWLVNFRRNHCPNDALCEHLWPYWSYAGGVIGYLAAIRFGQWNLPFDEDYLID